MKWNEASGKYELTEDEFGRVKSWEASDDHGAWVYTRCFGGATLAFAHRNSDRARLFEHDMARYGITVEEERKAEGDRLAHLCRDCASKDASSSKPPCLGCVGTTEKPNFTPKAAAKTLPKALNADCIDKHAVADAIEIAVNKCLSGTYTGKITDCKVCEIMGYREKTEKREPCQRCPLGPSVLPTVGAGYGCYGAMRDIENKRPGAAARVYAIIDSLRNTLGDDQWIEIAPKKKTVKREELADEIEKQTKRYLDGGEKETASDGVGCFSRRLCDIFCTERACRSTLCPVSKYATHDGIGCTSGKVSLLRAHDISMVRKVLDIARDLRTKGGEIEVEV